MTKLTLTLWGYAVEIVLAALMLVLLCLIYTPSSISIFVRQSAIDVATLFCAILFAASLAFLWTFYSKADTDFYRWLYEIDAFNIYLSATGYAVAINAAATLMLILAKFIVNDHLALTSIFMLFLAAINGYTLVQNVFGLMKLNAKFNQKSRNNS